MYVIEYYEIFWMYIEESVLNILIILVDDYYVLARSSISILPVPDRGVEKSNWTLFDNNSYYKVYILYE